MHAFFELGGDDPIAPDVCGGCVGLLARVNVEESGRVAGLDYFAGEDGVGEACPAAVSLNVLGYTGCIEEDNVTTGTVERLRDAMHLYSGEVTSISSGS